MDTDGETSTGDPSQLALGFENVPYDTQLSYVTEMKFLPDGSDDLLVIDLYGGVELVHFAGDRFERLAGATLDDVYTDYDAGLLALAIDPGFADNGVFYLSYTVTPYHLVLRRYVLDRSDLEGTLADPVDVIDIDLAWSQRFHNITSMDFDESGVMWVMVGDKGLNDPAQDPADLLGSLIRILPEAEGGYSVPDDPVTYAPDADPAIVALGLRSPWKGLYHEGRWYYGDVGLNDVEEINVIELAPGQNYGWPLVEGPCALDVRETGPHDCTQYVDPWLHYEHGGSHVYVTDDLDAEPTVKRSTYAGWIYQPRDGDPYEGLWNDVLLFGDAFVGFVRAQPLDAAGDESWHAGHLLLPSAWVQAPDGYVYVTALANDPPTDDDPPSEAPSPMHRAVLLP